MRFTTKISTIYIYRNPAYFLQKGERWEPAEQEPAPGAESGAAVEPAEAVVEASGVFQTSDFGFFRWST